jgi:uncharacterized protein
MLTGLSRSLSILMMNSHASHRVPSIEARIKLLLKSILPHDPERVYLFGSAARGEADELSDLDVIVILHSHLSFFERLSMLGGALPLELGAVDLLAYSPEEWEDMISSGNAFAQMVSEEGEVLYERAPQR